MYHFRSLRILGLEPLALAFRKALTKHDTGYAVGKRSLTYWDRAAFRPLHLPPDEENENATGVAWLRDVVPE